MKQPRKSTIANTIREKPHIGFVLDCKLDKYLSFSSWTIVYNLIWNELKDIICVGVGDRVADTIPGDD